MRIYEIIGNVLPTLGYYQAPKYRPEFQKKKLKKKDKDNTDKKKSKPSRKALGKIVDINV